MIELSYHLAAILILFLLFIGGLGGIKWEQWKIHRFNARSWKRACKRLPEEFKDIK